MIHKTTVEKYQGTLKELARDIGDLRYDALNEFLVELGEKIIDDGIKDKNRGRKKLYNALYMAFEGLNIAQQEIGNAWKICSTFVL